MLRTNTIVASLLLALLPVAAFSHPGHADGSPLLHEVTHAVHYLMALIAGGIWAAQGMGRALRSRAIRTQFKNQGH